MVSEINQKLKEEENRKKPFRTFSNYFASYNIGVAQLIGNNNPTDAEIAPHVKTSGINTKTFTVTELADIKKHARRGMLCNRSISMFADADWRGLPLAAHWISVQAYYAIHGIGLAALLAAKKESPNNHAKFRKSLDQLVAARFPSPLNAICEADPINVWSCKFTGINSTEIDIVDHKNLLVASATNFDLGVGKSLHKTRDNLVKITANNQRVVAGKKRISKQMRDNAYKSFDFIALPDLFWWMRIRSNYQDTYMFEEPTMSAVVTEYCEEIRRCVSTTLACLKAITLAGLPKSEIQAVQSIF